MGSSVWQTDLLTLKRAICLMGRVCDVFSLTKDAVKMDWNVRFDKKSESQSEVCYSHKEDILESKPSIFVLLDYVRLS